MQPQLPAALSGEVNLHIGTPPVRRSAAGSCGCIHRLPVLFSLGQSCLYELGKGCALPRHIQLPSIGAGDLYILSPRSVEGPGSSGRIILCSQSGHKRTTFSWSSTAVVPWLPVIQLHIISPVRGSLTSPNT